MNSQFSYDHVPRGAELRSLLNYILQLIAELESAMTSLPHVAKDGSSDCPFAGELYAKRLNLEETRRCYSEAESEQEREYRRAVEDRDAVYIVLKKAEAVLEVSNTRKLPGGIFKETQGLSAPGSHSSGDLTSAVFSEGSLGGELDGLMSLGPLN